jgi:hypothetical protein
MQYGVLSREYNASLNPRPLRERESHESFDKLRTGFSE